MWKQLYGDGGRFVQKQQDRYLNCFNTVCYFKGTRCECVLSQCICALLLAGATKKWTTTSLEEWLGNENGIVFAGLEVQGWRKMQKDVTWVLPKQEDEGDHRCSQSEGAEAWVAYMVWSRHWKSEVISWPHLHRLTRLSEKKKLVLKYLCWNILLVHSQFVWYEN